MTSSVRFWAPLAAIGIVTVASLEANAEFFIDVYGGASFTGKEDLDSRFKVPAAGVSLSATDEIDFDTSPTGGARFGFWFPDASFFGIALDASYFRPNSPSADAVQIVDGSVVAVHADLDIDVYPISALLMFRTRLLPVGRLGFQPYVAVGPGFFLSSVDDALELSVDGETDSFDDISLDVGADARAGMQLHLTRWLALFAEYRFTYFEPKYEDELIFDLIRATLKPELETHHVVGGVGFHF